MAPFVAIGPGVSYRKRPGGAIGGIAARASFILQDRTEARVGPTVAEAGFPYSPQGPGTGIMNPFHDAVCHREPLMLTALPHPLLAPSLVVVTAMGYTVMTVGMKATSSGYLASGILLAVVGFGVAFLAEIVLMRRIDLSVIYIVIVAAETLLVLTYAAWIGEGLALRQLFGAVVVVTGLMLVTS